MAKGCEADFGRCGKPIKWLAIYKIMPKSWEVGLEICDEHYDKYKDIEGIKIIEYQ